MKKLENKVDYIVKFKVYWKKCVLEEDWKEIC